MSHVHSVIRLALVEDCPKDFRKTVELLRACDDFECVAACRSGRDALRTLPVCQPEIVLMDIQMEDVSGVDCVAQLRPLLPQTQFMMLTVVEDHDRIFESLAAGATGYLLKKTPPAKLFEAIRELHAGGAPMSGQIARQVVDSFKHTAAPNADVEKLSPIEQRALQLLARGLLYKEVADELGISTGTVRTHIWHIYRKLHAHNRTEAILKGLPR